MLVRLIFKEVVMKKLIMLLVFLLPLSVFSIEEKVRCNDSNDCSVTIVKPVEAVFFEKADISSIVGNTRIAELVTTRAEFYTGVYLPVISFKTYGYELVNLNFGVAAKNEEIKKGLPYISTGIRLDGFCDLIGISKWARKHLSIVKLPPIETGAFITYNFRDEVWLTGLFISTKIGGI
jgi:hypothetical protein